MKPTFDASSFAKRMTFSNFNTYYYSTLKKSLGLPCRKTKVTNWMDKFYKLDGGDWGEKNKSEYTDADKDFFYRIVFIDGVPRGELDAVLQKIGVTKSGVKRWKSIYEQMEASRKSKGEVLEDSDDEDDDDDDHILPHTGSSSSSSSRTPSGSSSKNSIINLVDEDDDNDSDGNNSNKRTLTSNDDGDSPVKKRTKISKRVVINDDDDEY